MLEYTKKHNLNCASVQMFKKQKIMLDFNKKMLYYIGVK